jgi:seryl-tRNA synthetase
MLQVNYIRENKDDVLKRLAIKNFKEAETSIQLIIEKDVLRRSIQKNTDDVKAEANTIAKQIGELMKAGKKDEAEKIKTRTTELKQKEKELDEQLIEIEKEIHAILVTIPNTPNLSVPLGKNSRR